MLTYHKQGKVCWAKHLQFQPYEFFTGILLRCLGQQCYYLTIAKYSQENFCSTLKNCESSAQRIFPKHVIGWIKYSLHTMPLQCTHLGREYVADTFCNVDINPAITPSLLCHNIPSNLMYLIVSSLCCISLNWSTALIKNWGNILDSMFVKSPHTRRKERLRIINRPALCIVVMNINLALIFNVT